MKKNRRVIRDLREVNFLICINMIFMFIVVLINKNNTINNYKTDNYVNYIVWSDEKELSDLDLDQSLLGDTSVENTDVSVTDSCQNISKYQNFQYDVEISENDKYLLAKIAQCEAGNQNIGTKELVVMVVLNRIKNNKFPNAVEDVIKENHNGVYQFSPLVKGGSWYNTEPTEESYKAVENVLNGNCDNSKGALYFESCSNKDNWHSRNLDFLYQSESMRFYK